MVFYRKYRPQKISELDNEEIRNKLFSVFAKKNSVHAFLFTGPKGLGKTSTARIVAKILNCETTNNKKQPTLPAGRLTTNPKSKVSSKKLEIISYEKTEPCNKCYQCKSIADGTNMDVLEIDGASNRGIDEIRDLREKIRLAPFKAQKKVYIIDEVHMLTAEAFNALLKTLEEPPQHSVFILCTTEPQKVPATIISRCFQLNFTVATNEELMRSFNRMVKGEGIKIDKEALSFIASLSDGSFRDGAKILEEMVFLAGRKKITKEFVEEKYQISGINYQVSEMLKFLKERKQKEALELISQLEEQGTDMKYFLEQMINELHSILLEKVGIKNPSPITQNSSLTLNEIKELVELLNRAWGEIKYAVLPQLPLEMAIIEWSQQSSVVEVALHQTVQGSPQQSLWQDLITQVKSHNHSVAGVLRSCSLQSFDGKKLVIEAKYKFHKERLEEKKTLALIEKIVEEITGKKIGITVSLKT